MGSGQHWSGNHDPHEALNGMLVRHPKIRISDYY